MIMKSYKIEIGNPKKDGEFIIYGFSAGIKDEKEHFRRANVISCLRLPLASENILRFKIKVPDNQCIHFFLDDKEVHKVEIKELNCWKNIEFKIKPERKKEYYNLKIKCENFIYYGRMENCFYLSEIEIKTDKEIPHFRKITETKSKSLSIVEKGGIYFGDLHIHSSFSPCGRDRNGTPEENLDYCIDKGNFDFASITDHAETLVSEKTWTKLLKIIERYNKEGSFVTIPGYEWTSDLYGHRNVYLAKCYEKIFHCMDPISSSPKKLWLSLKEENQKAITVPHHPSLAHFPVCWDEHDEEYQPLVEICSNWGSSEFYDSKSPAKIYNVAGISVQDALIKGLKLGFAGGSDGHDRPPGTGGLTGVFAENLTREEIFESLKNRRCYATTGAKIKLYFIMNNLLTMGDEIVVNPYQFESLYPLIFYISVEGTAPIERIDLLENNQVIFSYDENYRNYNTWSSFLKDKEFFRVEKRMDEFVCLEIPVFSPLRWYQSFSPRNNLIFDPRLPNHTKFYYVRVKQKDGHMAWSSPIWITCKIEECERVKIPY